MTDFTAAVADHRARREREAAAREPRPPEELVGALQDRVHRELDRVRPARSVRVLSGERVPAGPPFVYRRVRP